MPLVLQRSPGPIDPPDSAPPKRLFLRRPSGGQTVLPRAKLELISHVPYDHALSGKGYTKLDLVVVYLFRGGHGKSPHETFFESLKTVVDGPRDGSGTADAAFPRSGQLLPPGPVNDYARPTNWLRDLLPAVIPPSRIICVGFDLNTNVKECRIDFEDASTKLISFLKRDRQHQKTRPMILLGHGFGCRVVQRTVGSIAQDLNSAVSRRTLIGVISQNAPSDEADPIISEVGLITDNHMAATPGISSNKNIPRNVARKLSETMEDHLILHQFYQDSPERDHSHALSFTSTNDGLLQLICTKIIEWVETFDLMSAVQEGDVDAVKQLVAIGIDVNRRKNAHKMTALHVACESVSWDAMAIQFLVEDGNANVALTDARGRTPLHYAVAREKPDAEVVRVLLDAGAETNVPDNERKTPQQLAEVNSEGQSLHEVFRSRPLVKGPSASRSNVKSDNKLLLPASALEVCKAYQMIATTLFLNAATSSDYIQPLHLPINEAIYGDKHLEARLREVSVPQSGDNKPICHWYHLPANNMTWIEDFLRDQFKMHLNGWPEQLRDSKWPHGRCINPHTAQFSTDSGRSVLAICMPYVSYEDNERHASVSKTIRDIYPSDASNRLEPWIGYANVNIQRRSRMSTRRQRRSNSLHPSRHSQGRSRSNSGSNRARPHEHDETASPVEPPSPVDAESGSDSDVPRSDTRPPDKTSPSNRANLLVREYLTKSPPLHIRRTLDQYYYYMLYDTRQRDDDQVVTRWARTHLQKEHHNILMVDQLWLWVIAGDPDQGVPPSVVSCFPERQGVESGPLDNLRSNIMRSRHGNHQPILPVRTTADLVSRIIATCSDVFSWSQKEELVRFLHFFEATVGKVGDKETRLLKQFTYRSEQLHTLSEKHRYYAQAKDLLLDQLLDIRPQTELLKEVKDIEDEIKIILHVLAEQQRVLQMDHIASFFGQQETPPDCEDTGQLCMEPLKIIKRAIGDFERLDKQIKEVYSGLTHLMDLQQKQASVWEARSTREGARATSKQGSVMVIFTMVTIIFLPLSFMASFFALDIAEFPADNAGQTNWPLHRVCALLFGISFAVIIPFITLAFVSEWVHGRFLWLKYGCMFPVGIFILEHLSLVLMADKCYGVANKLEDCRDEYYGKTKYTEDHIVVRTDIGTTDDPPPYKPDCNGYDDTKPTVPANGHLNKSVLPRWMTRRRRREPQSEV